MPEDIFIQKTTNLNNEPLFISCFPVCNEVYEDSQLRLNTRDDLENITKEDSSFFEEIPNQKNCICVYYLQSREKYVLKEMIDSISSNYHIRYNLRE